MKLTEGNYETGCHTRWERALHLAESQASPEQGGCLAWRQRVVDDACRKLKGTANDIIACEVCQERIAQCVFDGKDPFDAGLSVRASLEAIGIRVPEPKRKRF